MDKRKTGVRLLGRDYQMLTDQPEEEVRRIARYTDRKLREMQLLSRQSDGVVAVLTCMTLAEELLAAEKENQRLRRQLERCGRFGGPEGEQLSMDTEETHGAARPGGK